MNVRECCDNFIGPVNYLDFVVAVVLSEAYKRLGIELG